MIVEAATEVTPALVDAFVRLTPMLSKSSPPPDEAMLTAIVTCPTNTLLMAYDDDGRAIGTLTLVVFPIPTGIRAWIEDVIVDESTRGQGVGAALSKAAIDRAATLGARTVDLTSRPAREAANRLYQRLGFKQRDTNVYRYADDADRDS